MNNDFPISITNESDLDYYENYLHSEFAKTPEPQTQLSQYLKAYIGKQTKIDFAIGNRAETRIGILLDTGDDFLVLKTPNRHELIIPLIVVKSLTILQNNIKLPHF